jgi:hypothetical protein
VGRQIINTQGQGLASSDARNAALAAIVAVVIVFAIFFGINATKLHSHAAGTGSPAGIATPAPSAT